MNAIQYNLEPGEETNEETWNFFLEVLPPAYWENGLYLVGEPYDHDEEGKPRYDAYQKISTTDKERNPITKYFYLGRMTKARAKEYNSVAF